jgi:hypothetical protein
MLASVNVTFLVVIAAFVVLFALRSFARRGASRRFQDLLEVRDGRVVLKEDVRRRLERDPQRLRRVEALIAKNYTVNERGEVAERSGARVEAAARSRAAPAPAPRPAPPASQAQRSLYRKPSTDDLLRGSGSPPDDRRG